MKEYQIALLPGDGVGPEVIAAATQTLHRIQEIYPSIRFSYRECSAGKAAYDQEGTPLPEATLETIRNSDAALLGALATGLVPPPSPMGMLRKQLGLFADVRPIKSLPGVWALKPDIDLIFVRENTEGFLADRNLYKGSGEFMPTEDLAISLRVVSRKAIQKISRYAFELAKKQNRKRITAAHKSNVLRCGDGFFLDIVRETAADYPEIELNDEYVDSVANNLIRDPGRYDMILTTNLYGDILSDEVAALVSNMVPTANIGADCAVFRPVHEARLSEAGKNSVDPLSMILCTGMMLRHLGELQAAGSIDRAVSAVLVEGRALAKESGGQSSTTEVVNAVCGKLTAAEASNC